MKRKAALLIAWCLAAVSILAACAGNKTAGSGNSGSGGAIVLTFPSIWVGADSKAEAFGKMINDFNEEYAGEIEIKVEEQTDYDAYRDKIRTQISTGTPPDIFTVESFADLELFAESGKLMDMTNFLSGSDMADRFLEGLIDRGKVDGINYGMPYENAYIPIMYNMELLEKAGVSKIPQTYDELWDAAEKLHANGIFPISQMTNNNAWTSMLWYSYILASVGGADVYQKGLDDPAFAQAAEILKKMFDFTSPDAIGADATVVNGHFFNERSAIYTNGTWILGRIKSEGVEGLYDNLRVGGSYSENGKNGGAFINVVQAYLVAGAQADPKREEAVQKFFEFITREDEIIELYNSSGSTFSVQVDVSMISNELQREIITMGSEAPFTIGHFQGSMPTAVANAFPAALEALVLGDVDAQGFVDLLKAAQ